jgi:hypothetical protein
MSDDVGAILRRGSPREIVFVAIRLHAVEVAYTVERGWWWPVEVLTDETMDAVALSHAVVP